MIKQLYTGSRIINDETAQLVKLELRSDIIRDLVSVIVGDADGADATIISESDKMGWKNLAVYGAYGRVRRPTTYGTAVFLSCDFIERDLEMAKLCDRVTGFWNGKWNNGIVGRSGTMKTCMFAARFGKPVRLFREDFRVWEEMTVESLLKLGVK